jgi:ABC-type nitrate/sulfonate/bicarbonate transport system permease component
LGALLSLLVYTPVGIPLTIVFLDGLTPDANEQFAKHTLLAAYWIAGISVGSLAGIVASILQEQQRERVRYSYPLILLVCSIPGTVGVVFISITTGLDRPSLYLIPITAALLLILAGVISEFRGRRARSIDDLPDDFATREF